MPGYQARRRCVSSRRLRRELIPDDTAWISVSIWRPFKKCPSRPSISISHLMARKLRVTGRLVSMNCEVSRYFKENTLKSYDLAGYHSVASMKDAPFTSNSLGLVCVSFT